MATHVRVLAYLNIAMGGLGVVLAAVVFALFGGVTGALAYADGDLFIPGSIVALAGTVIIAVVLCLSVPFVVAGFGLLGFSSWARYMMLVLCAINLLHVPLGTILGLYGFWVLLKPETEALFVQRPA